MKSYILFISTILFSLLAGISKSSLAGAVAVSSFILMLVALWKPSLALPFLKDITRKRALIILITTFILGVGFLPKIKNTNELNNSVKIDPTNLPTKSVAIVSITTNKKIIDSTTKTYPTIKIASPSAIPTFKPTTPTNKPTTETYNCDCNKKCTQISSCAEAQYLLKVCGCSTRDTDGDGIACDGAPLNCQF